MAEALLAQHLQVLDAGILATIGACGMTGRVHVRAPHVRPPQPAEPRARAAGDNMPGEEKFRRHAGAMAICI